MSLFPKNARFIGEPLDYIEARQVLENTHIDNAIVVVGCDFYANSCIFSNVVFVCKTHGVADDIRKEFPEASPNRVIVGGMADAISLLAFASVKGC